MSFLNVIWTSHCAPLQLIFIEPEWRVTCKVSKCDVPSRPWLTFPLEVKLTQSTKCPQNYYTGTDLFPLWDIRLWNLSDLDFDLSRSLNALQYESNCTIRSDNIRSDGAVGLTIYEFLLVSNSDHISIFRPLAVVCTLSLFVWPKLLTINPVQQNWRGSMNFQHILSIQYSSTSYVPPQEKCFPLYTSNREKEFPDPGNKFSLSTAFSRKLLIFFPQLTYFPKRKGFFSKFTHLRC